MTITLERTTDFREHLAALGLAGDSDREAALARFEAQGIPSTKNEEWKYTNLRDLAGTKFVPRADTAPDAATLERLRLGDSAAAELVFVNGRYSAAFSTEGALPKGVRVASLADVVAEALGSRANVDSSPFTALNAALWEDGGYVHVSKGVAVEKPIHLIFLSCGGPSVQAIHPRVLIVLEDGATAKVVESYGGTGAYFNNAISEVLIAEGALLDHTKVQEESESAFHVATVEVLQAGGSTYGSHNVGFGGKLVRNDLNVRIDGEHCETRLNGAYTAFDKQLVDNHTRIDHALPNCHSFEVYKGILGDEGVGVFNGKIYVHQDAQKTDAKQTNKALLLSPTATMNTKPQLEIYADDVKCTHGATVGQLDEEQLFYLRSRGLSSVEAKTILTYAFVSEVLEAVSIEPLRDRLEARLMDRVRSAAPAEV